MSRPQGGSPRGVMAQAPDPVAAHIAPFTNRTSLLIFGGGGLIIVNLFFGNVGVSLGAALGFPPAVGAAAAQSGMTESWLDLGLQIGGLGALLVIASVSDEGGSFALLFLAALWLGWLYTHRSLFASLAKTASPSSPSTSTGTTGTSTGAH